MNRSPLLFLGILVTLALSFWVLVFVPETQIGQQQATNLDTGELYPPARSGLAKKGAEIYRAEGCVECHSQQVRHPEFASDYGRGWGPRITVAQDYLGDYPVMLGAQRIGPDLANIGARRDAAWHLQHLYDPQGTVPGSMMSPYRYLFEKRKVSRSPSPQALKVANLQPGFEVVPTDAAEALVAYLMSLSAQVELFEAPVPRRPGANTNAPAGTTDTNATNNSSVPATQSAPPPK